MIAPDIVALWLPRTRGDGPTCRASFDIARRLPRTRGDGPEWAPIATLPATGSPAHAGMDPIHTGTIRHAAAPPHTRGWTPGRGLVDMRKAAPPHTRGWTLENVVRRRLAGSPAHAGMDPLGIGWSRVKSAPPHTRGWTPRWVAWNDSIGSPAHAGMDPLRPVSYDHGAAPPHTRGWTRNWKLARVCRVAPPHTRGWTHFDDGKRQPYGSPAHAGMDPAKHSLTPRKQAPPHTRGWTL